jgi:hypothetical protein
LRELIVWEKARLIAGPFSSLAASLIGKFRPLVLSVLTPHRVSLHGFDVVRLGELNPFYIWPNPAQQHNRFRIISGPNERE